MPVVQRGERRVWQRRDRRQALLSWLGWLAAALLVAVCWRLIAQETMWLFVWDAPRQASDFFARSLPPKWSYLDKLWRPLWDTVTIATLGTLLAIVVAVPAAFLAARNTSPHPLLRQAALLLIVASRSINSLIYALLLVAILGPGVLAGVIAIGLRSIGFVAKLLYEAIEEIDPQPLEAVSATGAGGATVLSYAVVPQITPAFAGIAVFRWDINIRESTVVGLVGAGGIGIRLNESVLGLAWNQATVIFLLIFALVLFSEWVSARVRQAIL